MATMSVKLLTVCCTFLVIFSVKAETETEDDENFDFLSEENLKVQPQLFEENVLKAIRVFKEIVKHGYEEVGFPSLDPYFMDERPFDFVTKDSDLHGMVSNVRILKLSEFEPSTVEFKLVPFYFRVGIFLKDLHIEGNYEVLGQLFNEIPFNGTGVFRSHWKNITLMLYLKPSKKDGHLHLKEVQVDLSAQRAIVTYTNELEGEETKMVEEKFALEIIDRIFKRHVLPLVNRAKDDLNRFLQRYTFDEVIKFILNVSENPNIFNNFF